MLPEAFLNRMKMMLGSEYEAFLKSYERESYHALRWNPLKRAGQRGEDQGRDAVRNIFHLTPVPWERNGFYYEKEDQPGKHPLHEAGAYYIQEPSAMLPVNLLGVRPGEKALDLCAAPGGKSAQIAAAMQGEGLLVSNEIHPARAKILSENIERMGVRNACVTNENPTRMSEKFPEYFDRILVDAPCSGEGMFRKNETASEEWSPENVEMCAARQDEILDCAAKMLRPGGRMVYSTCTFAPQENEGSIRRFLERHPDYELVSIDKEGLGLPENVCDGREGLRETLRLWPHHIKGEGHFAAVMQKAGGVPEGYEAVALGGLEPGISPKDHALDTWWDFAGEELGISNHAWREAAGVEPKGKDCRIKGKLLRFGDNLYIAPLCMPSLKGLKVLRPGLHIGTLKKDRFEPAHALAMALSDGKTRHVCRFLAEDALVREYLKGQTFPMEGEKGWYLICVDGFSLGWGKLAGGVMKNHYPKGLRRG